MKLSPKTMAILKNFAIINQGIKIMPGKVLSTVPVEPYLISYADVEEEFPHEAQIWDLPMFLQVLSVLEDPEIDWQENHAIMTNGKLRWKFNYGQGVKGAPSRERMQKIPFQTSFNITAEEFNKTMKMANTLQSYCVVVNLNDDTKRIELEGKDRSVATSFSLDVEPEDGISIRVPLRKDHIKLLPLDYKVSVNEKLVLFENKDFGIMYAISKASHEDA